MVFNEMRFAIKMSGIGASPTTIPHLKSPEKDEWILRYKCKNEMTGVQHDDDAMRLNC